jgi:hypothetical protein
LYVCEGTGADLSFCFAAGTGFELGLPLPGDGVGPCGHTLLRLFMQALALVGFVSNHLARVRRNGGEEQEGVAK